MGDTQKYVFHGRVVPERSNVNINTLLKAYCKYGRLKISIVASQINVVLHPEREIDNILTARNAVESAVYGILDIFSFTHGYSYSVEITSVTKPNDECEVFGVVVGRLKNQLEDSDRIEMFNRISILLSTSEGVYLRRCLKDLRLAGKDAKDTGLFCYRSIESIRKFFHEKFGIPDDNKKNRASCWEKMRNELDIDRDPIDDVKEFADEPRHGGDINITDEERADVFEKTWHIVKEFITYLENEEDLKELSIDELAGQENDD